CYNTPWQCHSPNCSLLYFNDTSTTAISTLSLHDALPIFEAGKVSFLGRGDSTHGNLAVRNEQARHVPLMRPCASCLPGRVPARRDRKSTRLNSSHLVISYAVFCLKKKITQRVPHSFERLV